MKANQIDVVARAMWAHELMYAWGFRFYRTHSWDKGSGTGNFIRNQYEWLLFGYRGKLQVKTRYLGNKIVGEGGPHSTKPIEAYRHIKLISFPPVLELFARPAEHLNEVRKDWKLAGLDIDGIDLIQSLPPPPAALDRPGRKRGVVANGATVEYSIQPCPTSSS
jgi:N6-adenosine-specific RNA methylase IME4